jgi:phosphate transport system protein
MHNHFAQEMDILKATLKQMVELVDSQVGMAIEALENADIELCRTVKERDKQTDAYENLIQVQCENLFALFQPVAVDLRTIITALKLSGQLERCGDIAVNIVNRTRKTAERHDLVAESQVIDMARQAQAMLKKSMTAFNELDETKARSILAMDDVVDGLNKSIFKFLVGRMKEKPDDIEPCAHLIVLTRQLERLADHATNIAENIIFLIEARIVAHQNL